MTIEEYTVQYLADVLDVPVSGDVPSPMPEAFVTVEQTGSGEGNRIRTATLAVQSWAGSRAEAAQLNQLVEQAMETMAAQPEISRAALNTSYNFTDTTRKRPRYQAVFEIVHYLD